MSNYNIPSEKAVRIMLKAGSSKVKLIKPGEADEINLAPKYFTYKKNGQTIGQLIRDNILEWEIIDDPRKE